MMTYTEATAENFTWGPNWCTPSKEQMDELLKAATSEGSTKVVCTYTQENSQWGFKFTGKEEGYTGNSVFFHAVYGEDDFGDAYYWSATADGGGTWRMRLCYGEGDFFSDWGSFAPTSEFLVRPVLKN